MYFKCSSNCVRNFSSEAVGFSCATHTKKRTAQPNQMEFNRQEVIFKFREKPHGAAAPILNYLNYRRNQDIMEETGMTRLHEFAAAPFDQLDGVLYFFGLGANINVQDNHHLTPLISAVLQKNYKIADFLITKGAEVNIQGPRDKTALHYLIDDMWLLKQKNEQSKLIKTIYLIKRLLQSGANPNLPDVLGETPLMQAVRINDLGIKPNKDILVELVKHGACVNCFNRQGISVLDFVLQHYQAEEGLEIVKLLIKTATLVNWKNKIFFELGENRQVCLKEFSDSCYTEVSRMKSFAFADNFNLCHFALTGGNASIDDKSSGKGIFDEVMETLVKEKFPIYEDFICIHFDRSFLIEKTLEINVYARNEKKIVYLNSDTISKLGLYLSDKDLFNLVRAYSKPDILHITNDKINQ